MCPPFDVPHEVVFTEHALRRIKERGTCERDVLRAIRFGTRRPTHHGRVRCRLTVEFNRMWNRRYYRVQQIVPVIAEDAGCTVVVTVYVFYAESFEGGGR